MEKSKGKGKGKLKKAEDEDSSDDDESSSSDDESASSDDEEVGYLRVGTPCPCRLNCGKRVKSEEKFKMRYDCAKAFHQMKIKQKQIPSATTKVE